MRLDRYLAATRTGLERQDAIVSDQWISNAADGAQFDLTYVTIRSDQRRCEFVTAKPPASRGNLILDEGLFETLADLQSLMMAPTSRRAGPAFAWLLASNTFRQERAFAAYHLCIRAAEQCRDLLAGLKARRSRDAVGFARDFILAHETAHLAYRAKLPWMADIRHAVAVGLEQLIGHVRRRANTPKQRPEGFEHHVGVPMEDLPEEMLQANFGAVLDVIEGNEALLEEASCDWAACLMMVSREAGRSFFGESFPPDAETSHWRLLDTLLLARRITMLLYFRSAYAQAAENIVREDHAYRATRQQIESNARFNIVTNLCHPFARGVLEHLHYRDGLGFDHPGEAQDLTAAFAPGLAADTERYHNNVVVLMEVIEPLRNSDLFAADYVETFSARPVDDGPTLRAADAIRDTLRTVI